MSYVVGSNNSYKPNTNTAWVRARLCNLQKGCTRLAAASDKVYQLISHGRWFSPGDPDSSTTKTDRHDIATIVLNVASKHQKLKNKSPRGTLGSLASLLAAILNIGNHDRNHKSEMYTLYAVAA